MSENLELPLTPPTPSEGPVIDPSSTAEPEVPRPTAPERPSTTSSPWRPHFEMPSAAPAGPFPHSGASAATGPGPVSTAPARARRGSVSTAPARARRAASGAGRLVLLNRTRAIAAGTSATAFLAILAGVALADRTEPGSSLNRTTADNPSSSNSSSSSSDPGLVRPDLGGRAGSAFRDPAGSPSDLDGSAGSGSGLGSSAGSAVTNPFSRGFSGGFSAVPGTGSVSPNTRSRGS